MVNKKLLDSLRKTFIGEGFDGLLISSVYNISYLTGYLNFTSEEREAFLFLTKTNQYLITDGRYSHAVKQQVPDYEVIELSSGQSHFDLIKNLTQKHNISLLGIEENNLTAQELRCILAFFRNIKHFSLAQLRIIKTDKEIDLIKKACQSGDQAFEYILQQIKPEMTEKEFAFKLEFFIKKQGADIAFKPIAAFGKNSAIPHHQTSNQKLKANDQILLDFGVKLDGYCSDMTRTVFFGKADNKQRKIYQTVLKAQQKAIEQLNNPPAGGQVKQSYIKASDINKVARDYITSCGYTPYSHGLGHGIGLQAHEPPFLTSKSSHILKSGMVFSLEPAIYIPDYGGIRIEDLFLLEENSLPQLTSATKDLIEL